MKNPFRTVLLTTAILLLSITEGWSLPECSTDFLAEKWNSCVGTQIFDNGDKYVGEFKDGMLHGHGTLTYADGGKYVGEWRDDKAHGRGTRTYADGSEYVGELKDSKFHGQGAWTYADGAKYVGELKDNKLYGQGTLTYADGGKYVGEWRDDKVHGRGTRTYADGTVEQGIWKDNEFLYAQKVNPPATPTPSKKVAATTPPPFKKIASAFPANPINIQFQSSKSSPDDIAVIIGNANYKGGKDIPDVTPAYADAAGIRRYVKQALGIKDENIIFLKDASQAELTATFGSKDNPKGQLFNYVKSGKSRVFVYFSGHGAPGGEDGDSYLVPSNAQASLIDLNGYPLKTLYKNLGKIPAKSVTVVLEACFSGASQSGSLVSKASPIYLKAKETNVPANITVISAGAANQIASWEQDSSSGLFTKYFLKGMSGEADAKPYGNSDGKVDYDELGRYFKDTLTYYARRYYGREQIPQIVEGGM